MKKIFKILAYTFLAFFIMFWIGILLISMVGGSSDAVKEEVETIAESMLGRDVTIVTFHEAGLFPDLKLKASTIQIGSMSNILSDDIGGYYISSVNFSVPFWSIFFNQPVVETFEVKGVSPILQRASWTVDSVTFQDGNPLADVEEPMLVMRAEYQDMPIDVTLGAIKRGKGYSFDTQTELNGQIADYQFSGLLEPEENTFILNKIQMGPTELPITGNLEGTKNVWKIDLDFGQESKLDAELRKQEHEGGELITEWHGSLDFATLHVEDIPVLSLFRDRLGVLLSSILLPGQGIELQSDIQRLAFPDGTSVKANGKVELIPGNQQTAQLNISGTIIDLPVDIMKQSIIEIQDWEGVLQAEIDFQGHLDLIDFTYTKTTGALKLSSEDGQSIDVPLNDEFTFWSAIIDE